MVEEGLLSAEELAHALQAQAESGKPLGETLVALGYASPGAVANALAEQHGGLLRTEFGVSTGLSSASDERPALHAAPPVAPLSPAPGTEHEQDARESGAPLGAGLRLAGAPAPAAAPFAEPASPPAATAAASAPVSSEEKAVEIAKFASLHTDLDAARAELEQKSTHLTEVSAKLDDTLSQLRASQAARDAFAAKAAELEANGQLAAEPDPAVAARAQELEQQAAQAANRVQELEAQLQAAAVDRDALQQRLLEADTPTAPDPALTARVEELEAHIEDMRNVVAAAEAHAEAETASIRMLEAELQTTAAGRDALAEQVAALQTKLNETLEATATPTPDPVVTARVEELEQQLQTAAAGRDALAEQVAALQAKLNETLDAPVAAPDPVITARVEELELLLQAAAADRDALQQKLLEVEAPAAADALLTTRVQELESRLRAAALEREGLTQSLSELQTRLSDTAQAREAEVARANAVAGARVTAVESQLKAVETERDALAQRLEELEGQLSKTSATHSAALDKLEEQLAERELRLAERAEEKARIDGEHQAALEQLRLERDELAGNLDELRSRLGETTAGHEAALANLEEQLVEREHRLAKRSDERASIEQEHRVALEELVLERNTLAANFDELQGLMSETTAAHETAFAKLEEQLATRERVLGDRTDEVTSLTQERDAALEELEQERVRAAEAAAALVVPDETMHVLLVPAFTGYMLLERTGPAPDAREVVEIGPGTWGEGRFVVSRIGPSPLPDGPKHCAFLEHA